MPSISRQSVFVLSQDAVFRDLNGEAVILDLASGTYYGLNPVGTRIWQLIERHGRLDVVLDELCREYDAAPDAIERDVLGLVASLAEAGLGEVQPM